MSRVVGIHHSGDEGKPSRYMYEGGRILRRWGEQSMQAVDWDAITQNLVPDPLISSEKYIMAGEAGRGEWGTVYAAKNRKTGELVALKVLDPSEIAQEQMVQRELDEEATLVKEGGKLVAASHVVPRTLEEDDKGKTFIRMPLYVETLAQKLGGDRELTRGSHVGNGLTLKEAIGIMGDVAEGIDEMQTRYKQIHPDIHPGNIMLDFEGRALITDLGSATVPISRDPTRKRDNIGVMQVRPYENFERGSHPNERTNSYAFGVLAYRLFTGENPFDRELENAPNPKKYMCDLTQKEIDKVIAPGMKKVPRAFRKLVRSCLAHNQYERPLESKSLKKELKRAIKNTNKWRVAWNMAKWPLLALGSAGLLGGIVYQAAQLEPPRVDMPHVNWGATQLDPPEIEGQVRFVGEGLENLPEITGTMDHSSFTVRSSSQYKHVAGLFKAYVAAMDQRQKEGSDISDFTVAQREMLIANTMPQDVSFAQNRNAYGPAAKAIEVAMHYAQTPNGTVDLEDTLAIGRLGLPMVNKARYAANSRDFADYVRARNDKGEFVIPDKEQRFLKTWLSYVQSEQKGESSNE